jgi:hypothetical protein
MNKPIDRRRDEALRRVRPYCVWLAFRRAAVRLLLEPSRPLDGLTCVRRARIVRERSDQSIVDPSEADSNNGRTYN